VPTPRPSLGDLPLPDLAELIARRPGRREVGAREAMLTALADGGASAPRTSPDVILTLARPAAELAVEFERLHGRKRPVDPTLVA
jgi:hypothetical protein